MRLLPMGAAAVLVEGLTDDPAGWSAGVRSLGFAGVIDVVPAARTVLIRCDSRSALAAVVERLHEVAEMGPADRGPAPTVSVPVRYDGPDLDEVAALTGRTVDEVVSLHAAARYEVAFCGFAPGFGYLRGLPSELVLPRRHTPRTRVPAGSVAIAAEYSAVYPTASPGGWHLLGSTDMVLFDVQREPPALLSPGSVVRFEPT